MAVLASTLLLTYALPIIFTCEVHKHPCHSEYGVRVCGGALVIGLGRTILRFV